MRVLVEDKALLLSLEDVKAVGDEIDLETMHGEVVCIWWWEGSNSILLWLGVKG